MLQPVFLQMLPLMHHGDDVNIVIARVVDNPPGADTDLVQVAGPGFRYALVRTRKILQFGGLV